ncbi:hypothetical protein BS78_06G034900 [Paspalum vaginatum]|nr:hypothetical protein BS78_06G034900 [Paspalum vaginatum]
MKILQGKIVAVAIMAILVVVSTTFVCVQANDKIDFTLQGIKGNKPKESKSVNVKSDNNFLTRKLLSAKTDGYVSHHQEKPSDYCEYLLSIHKSCAN